jgi:hypothetical protein
MAAAPKKHVEPQSIVTSETVIQSRDKEHDWTDLSEQSHWDSLRESCSEISVPETRKRRRTAASANEPDNCLNQDELWRDRTACQRT